MPVHYRFDAKPDRPVARIEMCGDDGMDRFFDHDGNCIGAQPTDPNLAAMCDNGADTLGVIRANATAAQIVKKPTL